MDKYSAKIRIRKDRVKTDGTALLYMQVIINSNPEKIPLDLYWPVEKFSNTELCQARHKKDTDANDYNMILRDAITQANEIFKYYRLANMSLNLETFRKEYFKPLSKTDFLLYMEQKIEERYHDKGISYRTYLNHKGTFNKLKECFKVLPFNTMNFRLPEAFDKFLVKKYQSKKNTRWGRHKDTKTYLELADRDNIKFEDPYRLFANSSNAGTWKPISATDVKTLYQYYQEQKPDTRDRRLLQRFLFSCASGLRLGDLKRIMLDWLKEDVLVFVPEKTKKSEKLLEMPLTAFAVSLLKEASKENMAYGDTAFFNYSDRYSNRRLQKIAEKLDIRSKLHNHVGRETFATLYLELGGRLEVLQQYLAHTKIETTMRYVHVSTLRKKNEIRRMDNLFDAPPTDTLKTA